MDLTLTDLLVCPHCGPPNGLILLADSVVGRRVLAGTLGCASCYRRYLVREGVADLRPEPGTRATPGGPAGATGLAQATSAAEGDGAGDAEGTPAAAPRSAANSAQAGEHAFRLAALMGLSDATGAGRAIALLAGPVATEAPAVAAVAEGYEIVAAESGRGASSAAQPDEARGVSRMLVAERLPFFDGSLRGVALSGEAGDRLLEEGLRVLNPMGRLVVEEALPGAAERIAAAGGRVVASEGSTLVALTLRTAWPLG